MGLKLRTLNWAVVVPKATLSLLYSGDDRTWQCFKKAIENKNKCVRFDFFRRRGTLVPPTAKCRPPYASLSGAYIIWWRIRLRHSVNWTPHWHGQTTGAVHQKYRIAGVAGVWSERLGTSHADYYTYRQWNSPRRHRFTPRRAPILSRQLQLPLTRRKRHLNRQCRWSPTRQFIHRRSRARPRRIPRSGWRTSSAMPISRVSKTINVGRSSPSCCGGRRTHGSTAFMTATRWTLTPWRTNSRPSTRQLRPHSGVAHPRCRHEINDARSQSRSTGRTWCARPEMRVLRRRWLALTSCGVYVLNRRRTSCNRTRSRSWTCSTRPR